MDCLNGVITIDKHECLVCHKTGWMCTCATSWTPSRVQGLSTDKLLSAFDECNAHPLLEEVYLRVAMMNELMARGVTL